MQNNQTTIFSNDFEILKHCKELITKTQSNLDKLLKPITHSKKSLKILKLLRSSVKEFSLGSSVLNLFLGLSVIGSSL